MKQMNKLDFNNLSVDEQVNYFNVNLRCGHKINEICDIVGISYNTMRDRFSRNHYTFNKINKQYECVEKIFPLDEEVLEKTLEKIFLKVFNPTQKPIEKDDKKLDISNLEGKVINRSFRVYDNVLNDFTKFCNESKYNQYDILSAFIVDGMKNYSNYQG